MPQCKISGVRVVGVHATVPATVRRFLDETALYANNLPQMERLASTLGFNERHVAATGQTALDLCTASARKLLEQSVIPVQAVDAVIFVTQTPDHFQPSNSALLHGRLGLPQTCVCFDVNQGCAGYIVGLWQAHSLIASGGCHTVLLLCGDTLSRCVHPQDRSVYPLFGDAGTATLLQADPAAAESIYVLHADGGRASTIQIPAGGFRQPATPEAFADSIDAEGNTRNPHTLHMDGAEVFNFSLKAAPEVVNELLSYSGETIDSLEAIIFHQANKYIVSNVARRLKLPLGKVPMDSFSRYGNTSGASIPLALVDYLSRQATAADRRFLLCGFGVGLTWGGGLVSLKADAIASLTVEAATS